MFPASRIFPLHLLRRTINCALRDGDILLPSLGVSSLDLGRTVKRAAFFLGPVKDSLFRGDRKVHQPACPGTEHVGETCSNRAADRIKTSQWFDPGLVHVQAAVDFDLDGMDL